MIRVYVVVLRFAVLFFVENFLVVSVGVLVCGFIGLRRGGSYRRLLCGFLCRFGGLFRGGEGKVGFIEGGRVVRWDGGFLKFSILG